MFIVGEFENISKPQRGGMALLAKNHAALLGLGAIVGRNRYYKRAAPPELAEVRALKLARMGAPGGPTPLL